jgi:hypothetical protein
MVDILRWPKHVMFAIRTPMCKVCMCIAHELPTECPGVPLHPDERAAVANGHLDYRKGRWVPVT